MLFFSSPSCSPPRMASARPRWGCSGFNLCILACFTLLSCCCKVLFTQHPKREQLSLTESELNSFTTRGKLGLSSLHVGKRKITLYAQKLPEISGFRVKSKMCCVKSNNRPHFFALQSQRVKTVCYFLIA